MKKWLSGILLATTITTASAEQLPANIKAIFDKPLYKNAKWGLRVIDAATNKVLIDHNSSDQFYVGSVRKIFSVGEFLNAVGPNSVTVTTVHYDGNINHGELKGNLVLVATGDLTMGGRTLPNGKLAYTNLDHNEANSIGNAELTQPDPLAGYKKLARQVKQAGISKISGDVVIDDRLFAPIKFQNQFDITPIFVNDDAIDIAIYPGQLHEKADVKYRPVSAAFTPLNHLTMAEANQDLTLELDPIVPTCIGKADCTGEVKNQLPINYVPPYTKAWPLVRTFRITQPSNYARTIFIEALSKEGIDVSAVTLTKDNPVDLLKSSDTYNRKNQLALLRSLPAREHAKLILKMSYNIGADTALVLFGKTQGVRTLADSLRLEKELLATYGIDESQYHFIDGYGGGESSVTNTAVTTWLSVMRKNKYFKDFYDGLPILSVNGTIGLVKKFQADASLKGAAGKVHAKPGTFVDTKNGHLIVEGQAYAGYIETRNNHQLIYQLVVNDVAVPNIEDVLDIFEDQGIISAILWRDF
jgi:D-alanyl-D-alanine carboxypeptidase